jgi:uncharacterized membrane protein YfcA
MDELLLFAAVGFAAQLVDGALGMAYGITATTVLLSMGVTPAVASASVHTAEVFTTGVSGAAHWRFGNIDRDLFWQLALPGMVGGATGALVLASIPGELIKPFVSLYLLVMGVVILRRAVRTGAEADREAKSPTLLGLIGGFLDASGGGGWGPMVASTLLSNGATPRYAIGTVNAAEFFVTSVVSATFIMTVGLELWPIIAGLVLGGALAAPFAAYATQKLPDRPLMILVAVLVILLGARNLFQILP